MRSDAPLTVFFAIPGELATPTGGYGYDRRLIDELPHLGWRVEVVRLPDGFPHPSARDLEDTRSRLDDLPDHGLLMVDGLAYGAMPDIARRLADRLRLIALVHHPLADETGLKEDVREQLRRSETAALVVARVVICTSDTTAARLVDAFGVRPARLVVAPPGTDRRDRARGSGGVPVILSVGTLVRRKGHDILIRALARLADRPWQARFVGGSDHDVSWAAHLDALARELDLKGRIDFVGAVADPRAELAGADIFALATRHEGYGMAFAEALAHGLPIVACGVGAVPEVVPDMAGFLVPPDDPAAFAAALGRLLDDAGLRHSMAEAAFAAGQALPTWQATARTVAHCLAEVAR